MKIERMQIPSPLTRSIERLVREENGTLDVDAVQFEDQASSRRHRDNQSEDNRDGPRRDDKSDLSASAGVGEEGPESGKKNRASLDIIV